MLHIGRKRWRNFYLDVGRRMFVAAFASGFLIGATVTNIPEFGAAWALSVQWMKDNGNLAPWAQVVGSVAAVFGGAWLARREALRSERQAVKNSRAIIASVAERLHKRLHWLQCAVAEGKDSEKELRLFERWDRDKELSTIAALLTRISVEHMEPKAAIDVVELLDQAQVGERVIATYRQTGLESLREARDKLNDAVPLVAVIRMRYAGKP